MKKHFPPLVAALLTATSAVSVQASQVTVFSADNSTSIAGEIVSYDDDYIVLRTQMGDLKLTRSGARCVGESCPPVAVAVGEVLSMTVATAEEPVTNMLRGMISEYAAMHDLSLIHI